MNSATRSRQPSAVFAFALFAALVALAAITLVLAGCGGGKQLQIDNSSGAPQEVGNGPPQLVAQANSPVVDIPIPVGFGLEESASEAQVTGNVRYVNHCYTGRGDKDRVARFYREQMQANHKWRLDFIRNAKGVWRLYFSKGPERCSLTIDENTWGTTRVHVEIFPTAP